jgi:hypothetical protein
MAVRIFILPHGTIAKGRADLPKQQRSPRVNRHANIGQMLHTAPGRLCRLFALLAR